LPAEIQYGIKPEPEVIVSNRSNDNLGGTIVFALFAVGSFLALLWFMCYRKCLKVKTPTLRENTEYSG